MSYAYIASVNISPTAGIPKQPCGYRVKVEQHGLKGDYHNRPRRESHGAPGTFKDNRWHVSLMAQEVIDDLNYDPVLAAMRRLQSGSLGENITTWGLGDLSGVPDGAEIVIDGDIEIVLRVVEHMEPCVLLYPLHPLLARQIRTKERNRRGLYCSVEQGVGGFINRHNKIWIR